MTERSKKPDRSGLFCEGSEYLYFVPVALALETHAVREALAQAETWGEVKRAISPERLAELVDWSVGGDEVPDDDEPFEPPDSWPFLRYSEMTDWLPDSVVRQFGQRFNSMLDSGVNFDPEDEDEMVEALEAAGVTVRYGGPDLESLFAEQG